MVLTETAAKATPVLSYGPTAARKSLGRTIIILSSLCLIGLFLVQALDASGQIAIGFGSWRPVLYGYGLWCVALGIGQVMIRGENGERALFVLPAVLFTVALVIFPTLFGLYIAFTDWNLSSAAGRQFNGLDNLRTLRLMEQIYTAAGVAI